MRIHSPTGNFIEVLQHIRDTALKYQSKLSGSEASTRTSLIDPLLRALGWDTSNPNMIEVERSIPPQSRVDYALLDSKNKIQVIIEAKSLGGNLSDNRVVLNLIMYALSSGVKDVFLTDGISWEHYTDYVPGNIVSSKTLKLTTDNLFDCALYLIQELDAAKYWPTEEGITLPGDQVSQQLLDLRNEISNLKSLMATIQLTQVPPEQVEVAFPPSSPDMSGFVDVSKIDVNNIKGKKPPTSLLLPDGTIKPIAYWRDILIETSFFVLKQNPSLPIPLKDNAGKTKYLLHTEEPEPGLARIPYEYNGKVIFLYSNFDSKNCVLNALYILRYLDNTQYKTPVAVKF